MSRAPSDTAQAPPRHVAIIMDGNGRWAKGKMFGRLEGHRAGVNTVRSVVTESRKLGIRYLTLFSFSTENWQRPADEVSGLMRIFAEFLAKELASLRDNNIRLRAIGDLTRLPETVRTALAGAMEATAHCDALDLILAISYGARDEIAAACRAIAREAVAGKVRVESIDEACVAAHLYAPDVPDPDLLIRTSDEYRISNFMLWQLAYAEIVVTPVLWPDFSIDEYRRCLDQFSQRTRRFGLTDEQMETRRQLSRSA